MKIFDGEKFERIKNARAAACSAYQAASKNWQFESEQLGRLHQMFCHNFKDFNVLRDLDDEFISIKKMPCEDFPAIQVAVQALLAKVPTNAQFYSHLKQLTDCLLSAKHAQSRVDAAAENQQNHTRCFDKLENFAKKYSSLVKTDNWTVSETVGNVDAGFDNNAYPMA